MNVSLELGERNLEIELLLQELYVAVQEVIGPLVALMDQRVVHREGLHVPITIGELGNPGVMLKECVRRRPDIGLKASRVGAVQVPHGGGEHYEVAGTLKRLENQLEHRAVSTRETGSALDASRVICDCSSPSTQ